MALVDGGGLYVGGTASSTLQQVTVSGNSAQFGGGVYTDSTGVLSLSNTTFSGNSALGVGSSSGGALLVVGTTVLLNNVTMTGNSSTFGGGLWNESSPVTFRNTILSGNSAGSGPDCGGSDLTSAGFNLIEISCSLTGDLEGNITGLDAVLGPLQLNGLPPVTHALLSGSPAIDAGSCIDSSGLTVTVDARGTIRPQVAACDIGAYEATAGALGIPGVTSLGLVALGVVMAFVAWVRPRPRSLPILRRTSWRS